MLRAKDIMTTRLITVSPKTEITKAARLLLENGINGMPVVDEGEVVGIICQSDLIAQQKQIPIPSIFTLLDSIIPLTSMKRFERAVQKIVAITVDQAMTRDPVVAAPETTVEELSSLMVDRNFHTIPVVDSGKLVGVVGKEDLLRTLMPSEEPLT